MNKLNFGFSLVELILAMFIAGIFIFMLGTMSRQMVASMDAEQQFTVVEQQARVVHERISRMVRDASAASIVVNNGCNILTLTSVSFGGVAKTYSWYADNGHLYEDNNTNCTSSGEIIANYFDTITSQITYVNKILDWSMVFLDGADAVPVRIVATPRNL